MLGPSRVGRIEITNLQKVCYRAVLEHNRGLLQRGAALVSGTAVAQGSTQMLAGSFANVSMMLRHCCNHPWLLKEVEEGALASLEAESSVRPPRTEREHNDPVHWHQQLEGMRAADVKRYVERLVRSSGKMVLLDKLLPKLKSEGHRVLLFSQVRMPRPHRLVPLPRSALIILTPRAHHAQPS